MAVEYDVLGMTRGSHSGSEPDRRGERPESTDRAVDGAETTGEPGDWIASVRDVDFTGNGSKRGRGSRMPSQGDDWVRSRSSDPDNVDIHWTENVESDLSERDEWWRMLP